MDINEEQKIEIQRQNQLLKQYMEKHFSSAKIKQLVEEFSFSELRKLMGEIDIEYFSLCFFPSILTTSSVASIESCSMSLNICYLIKGL